jgi:MFS family permease
VTRLPRPVWRLGWVSLLTDAASEAIYPLLPFFLTRTLGGTATALGIVEGLAEGTSSLLRIVSGRLADRWGARRGLVVAGYSLSSVVRPFVGLAGTWTEVAGIRFLDRIGKGVRSAPRDALLAAWAPAGERGRVFGFHRAMDHAGAVIGPVAATSFLLLWPGAYRSLFAWTAVPGLLAVWLVWSVREGGDVVRDASPAEEAPADAVRPAPLPRAFRRYLAVVGLFSIGNSSDAFLLLALTDAAGGPAWIPLAWAGLHVVKAGLSTRGGALSDRFGRTPVIAAGWLLYAVVYAGFALAASFSALVAWLLIYGVHFALTEGAERALVADLVPSRSRGTAFGLFHAVTGVGALVASLLFGMVWSAWGARTAFAMGAALALAAAAALPGTVRTSRDAARSAR